MHAARRLFPAPAPHAQPPAPDRGSPDGLLCHVPAIDLAFDGDCAQANGLDLPVVVINLLRRKDRWQTLTRRMSAVGLDKLIHGPAVDGARLPHSRVAALLGSPAADIDQAAPRSHLALTRGAIGCFCTHLAIWRWMLTAGLPRLLVLEDDAMPTPHFDAGRLARVLGSLPQDAGLVFLGALIMAGLADCPRGSELARLYYFNGTFAYLITPAACRTLLRRLLPLSAHLDHQMSGVLIEERRRFPAYYTAPAFFEPDWSQRSDCYVPLADEAAADREFGAILESTRLLLVGEGRPLLPA